VVSAVLAHDLLWGMSPAQLPADAPTWACAVLAQGQPVVVRRALATPGQVAVGVRGPLREQRYASFMAVESISRCVRPEQLCHVESVRDLPALRALALLRGLLDEGGLIWGVSGSAGFELASGVRALHQQSDLDLILRTPAPLDRDLARALLQQLEAVECRVDLQLQTPQGAVALAEWAGTSSRVLLKNARQACLVSDPWQPLECAA
jgi:phosphoribosyl-dephospho-CoA transferase